VRRCKVTHRADASCQQYKLTFRDSPGQSSRLPRRDAAAIFANCTTAQTAIPTTHKPTNTKNDDRKSPIMLTARAPRQRRQFGKGSCGLRSLSIEEDSLCASSIYTLSVYEPAGYIARHRCARGRFSSTFAPTASVIHSWLRGRLALRRPLTHCLGASRRGEEFVYG
jgi:hypothetical protein